MGKKLHLAGILLAFCIAASAAAPMAARATTANESSNSYLNYGVEQLQALIAKLQARLEELKKGSPCFVTETNLSLGDGEGKEASDVVRLQDFLREKGLFSYKSTGYFGKVTRSALALFQKNNGLEQTGEFDSATKAKAHSLFCTKVKAKLQAKNEEKKEVKAETANNVESISMSVNGASVSWTVSGRSPNGFKIVWSKNAAPTYPTREGDRYIYLSDPSANSTTLQAFDGSGTYHVRVCEYLGGACGKYSNEATAQL